MGRHTKITAAFIILLSLVLLWFFSAMAMEKLVQEKTLLYGENLKLLAAQARVLISKSATPELQGLIDLLVKNNDKIDFCFIVSGGRPFLHTFAQGFPEEFPVIEAGLSDEVMVTPVTLKDAGEYQVMSLLMGFGSASIHMGVKKSILSADIFSYSLLPFVVPLSAIALSILVFLFFLVSARPGKSAARQATGKYVEKNISIPGDNLSAQAPCGLLLIEPQSMSVRFANNHAARLFQGSVKQLLGVHLDELLYSSEAVNLDTARNGRVSGARGSLFTGDGGKVPVFINSSTLKVKNEELIILSVVDLSSQRELEERYKKAYAQQESLANHDKLTGLFNRRALTNHAEAELNRAERGEHLSIIILDLDHFKQVNDTYGHNVGDIVLQSVSRVLQQTVRPYDWLGRWGGEEFIIILPGTGLKTATIVAERIREKVESSTVRLKGYDPLRVTVSFGVVNTTNISGNSFIFDKLVDLADKALYFSKSSGRNKVSVYIDGTSKLASFNRAEGENEQ